MLDMTGTEFMSTIISLPSSASGVKRKEVSVVRAMVQSATIKSKEAHRGVLFVPAFA